LERLGTGRGVAALLNGRAKRVTPRVVRALERALPQALILVSEDFDQARRHARTIVREKPSVVLSGGGDGAICLLLNLLREAGAHPLPPVGVLKLGTGNGWARVSGAPDQAQLAKVLPQLPRALPTSQFDLVEVEDRLCHFTGVGWDAKILNDYLRNLDRRSSQLVGSRLATRLHKGLGGYLYSVLRYTVPEEWQSLRDGGQPQVLVENRGGPVFFADPQGEPRPLLHPSGGPAGKLYEGPVSVGGCGTTEEFGYGFKGLPLARKKPGFINVRIYDRPVLDAVKAAVSLWRGDHPQPGAHDFFATAVQFTFARPMPFQIGGDGEGMREEITFRVAKETVPIVDWAAAMRQFSGA
jgi:diacylglycerol kinase family enzyme